MESPNMSRKKTQDSLAKRATALIENANKDLNELAGILEQLTSEAPKVVSLFPPFQIGDWVTAHGHPEYLVSSMQPWNEDDIYTFGANRVRSRGDTGEGETCGATLFHGSGFGGAKFTVVAPPAPFQVGDWVTQGDGEYRVSKISGWSGGLFHFEVDRLLGRGAQCQTYENALLIHTKENPYSVVVASEAPFKVGDWVTRWPGLFDYRVSDMTNYEETHRPEFWFATDRAHVRRGHTTTTERLRFDHYPGRPFYKVPEPWDGVKPPPFQVGDWVAPIGHFPYEYLVSHLGGWQGKFFRFQVSHYRRIMNREDVFDHDKTMSHFGAVGGALYFAIVGHEEPKPAPFPFSIGDWVTGPKSYGTIRRVSKIEEDCVWTDRFQLNRGDEVLRYNGQTEVPWRRKDWSEFVGEKVTTPSHRGWGYRG